MYWTHRNQFGVHSTAAWGQVTVRGIPWIPIYAQIYPLAYLMGPPGMHAPLGSKFFHFHANFSGVSKETRKGLSTESVVLVKSFK